MGHRAQVEGTAREDGPSTWREKSREGAGVVWVTKRIGGDGGARGPQQVR